jgi:predicted enzyme related to lactoylglutathione lyase
MGLELLVNIDVDDLERATAFYTAALPLRVGRRFGGGGAVELLGAGAPIYLLAKPAGSGGAPGAARGYGRHWTPVHLDFAVDDLDAAVVQAVAAGAVLEAPARAAAWGSIALLADPFGHGFCLLRFSERGYDAIADPPVTP